MCISNINVTTKLYKKRYIGETGQYFDEQFDTIIAKTQDGSKYIEDFFIVISFNLLGTNNNEKKSTNIVDNKQKLFVEVRLNKLSKNAEHQMTATLENFNIDLASDDIKIQQACIPYVIYDRILNVAKIKLPNNNELGNYVIKVLIKTDENAEKWSLQSIYPLRIE